MGMKTHTFGRDGDYNIQHIPLQTIMPGHSTGNQAKLILMSQYKDYGVNQAGLTFGLRHTDSPAMTVFQSVQKSSAKLGQKRISSTAIH